MFEGYHYVEKNGQGAKKRFEIDQGGFDRGMEQETEDGGKESGESLGVPLEKEWGEGDPGMG